MANILVVDDDPVLRAIIEHTLTRDGHCVAIASDSYGAIDRAQNEVFDIVISDINMPGLSGLNLVTTLRKLEGYASTPIMFLTGRKEKHDVISGIKSGANDYLIKPVDPTLLLSKVKDLLLTRETSGFAELSVNETVRRVIEYTMHQISERGVRLLTDTPILAGTIVEVESDLFRFLQIETVHLRAIGCQETPGETPLYDIQTVFYGVPEEYLIRLRRHILTEQSKRLKTTA